MNQKKQELVADLMLAAVAIIWGLGFPLTKMVVDANLGAGLVVALRFTVAAAVVSVVFRKELKTLTLNDVRLGGIGGLLLGIAFLLQVAGQKYTTPSNSAFLTSLSVVLVPFLSWALFRNKPSRKTALVAVSCFAGAAVLTISPEKGLVLNVGDLLTVACAVFFSLHIAYLGKIAGHIETRKLTFMQMITAAVIGICYTGLMERAELAQADFQAGILPILFLGLFSTAFSFFAQTYAQKHTSPARAAIILGTEGLLGSIFSVLMGYEQVTVNLVAGGLIIFFSLLVMEVDPRSVFQRRKQNLEP